MTKVLISAYACEPGQGSEAGIGWNWVKQADRFCDVWTITRLSNRAAIENHLRDNPLRRTRFVYYDLPAWMSWWKKGSRGVHLYYYLWQIGILGVAKRLHAEVGFDLVHHVTFGSYWMPTRMGELPVPFVWGPVGGGESAPRSFYRTFSLRSRLNEHLRDLVRTLAEADPLVRSAARKAQTALATTNETAARIEQLSGKSVDVLSHVALPRPELDALGDVALRTELPFRVLSIGRLIGWKGFHLGLRAFAGLHREFRDSEYWIIGDGPERKGLERLARRLGIQDAVKFVGRITRRDTLEALAECDVLLHPSLHDSGGYVCAEAIAAGRPVVCFAIGGPATLVSAANGFAITPQHPDQAIRDLTEALVTLAHHPDLRLRLAETGRRNAGSALDWNSKGNRLPHLYRLIATSEAGVQDPAPPRTAPNLAVASAHELRSENG